MKRASAWFVTGAFAIGFGILGGCAGGTSSETVGMAEATPASDQVAVRTDAGSSVGLYSADFLPHTNTGFARTVTADSEGIALFPGLKPGVYDVVVRQISLGKAALIPGLAVPASGDETVRARLETTGTLAGTITDSLPVHAGFVYVPGTPFFAPVDSLMRYTLPGLPPGRYAVVKTWSRPVACDSSGTCGGNSFGRDSAFVQIHPGENAIW